MIFNVYSTTFSQDTKKCFSTYKVVSLKTAEAHRPIMVEFEYKLKSYLNLKFLTFQRYVRAVAGRENVCYLSNAAVLQE
jgi:hypothetical protein